MKKVFFGAAALLFSGALMAQEGLNANGTATNGSSATDPTVVAALPSAGGFWNNTGKSVQEGTNQKVYVGQAGANNSVLTMQDNGSGTGENKARIWQTGDVNNGFNDSGYGNAAEVRQSGTDNQSTTNQEGDFNEGLTLQGQKDDASSGNKARIDHGTGQQGEDNFAMIEQDGEDNSSRIVQQYDNSEARSIQEGDDNISDIRQNAGPDQSAGHLATTEQYGDDNVTRVRQYGSARNVSVSVQEGDNNKVNQNQTSNAVSGVGNNAEVTQGKATTNALGNSAYLFMNSNVDMITNGTMNVVNPSDDNLALQNQSGENNDGFIGQWGDGDGNYGEQNQSGKDNSAALIQNAYGNANGGNNYGRQDQSGENNMAGAAQLGFNHKLYQRQFGDDNTVYSTQRGNSNLVSTYQFADPGKGNAAHTAQRGQNNQILLVQKTGANSSGGHSYTVEQGLGGSPHSGNQANILQLGPDGNFATDAENCDFQAPQDLVCPPGLNDFDLDAPCVDTGSGC
ncbi:hypothetical protein [Bizionia paragorgiae]|uniref:Curlin associated repeat-containing protein n=1 Tax=Bizionia paragorgiae TaxID=283786 RepID=A0A1H3VIX4_BIZPA|nr:hypothetical protein [Bizionia paragorgiae]SDZ74716.1 hypothetical protein SAMN04487990_101204 [Bizionia paragorgiae]